MDQICSLEECTGCGACAEICPKKCIEMKFDSSGFLNPEINVARCIDCNACVNVCPSINCVGKNILDTVFKAYSLDKNILIRSTSGGIFSELSIEVLNRGGVVFGAAFNEKFDVNHVNVHTIDELDKLRGSKYIQSNSVGSFVLIKQLLKENVTVLYTGTPCQIAGLKQFLKKEYTALILCDFLCHGVGSTKVFHEYLKYLSCEYKSTPQSITFRSKIQGYEKSQFTVQFENKKYFSCRSSQSAYTYGFATKLLIRESCIACKYAGTKRVSDITIADYAGPDFSIEEKKNGVSTVFCNTDKGVSLLLACKDRLYLEKKKMNEITSFTNNLNNPYYKNPKRDAFFKDLLNDMDFKKLKNKYLQVPISIKLNNFYMGRLLISILMKLKNTLKWSNCVKF